MRLAPPRHPRRPQVEILEPEFEEDDYPRRPRFTGSYSGASMKLPRSVIVTLAAVKWSACAAAGVVLGYAAYLLQRVLTG